MATEWSQQENNIQQKIRKMKPPWMLIKWDSEEIIEYHISVARICKFKGLIAATWHQSYGIGRFHTLLHKWTCVDNKPLGRLRQVKIPSTGSIIQYSDERKTLEAGGGNTNSGCKTCKNMLGWWFLTFTFQTI